MNYKEIIATAWYISKENKRLIKWYAFLPAMLATLVGVLEVFYQIMAFKKAHVFTPGANESFAYDVLQYGTNFVTNNPRLGLIIIPSIIIFIFIDLIIPPCAKASIIQLVARIYNGQKVQLRDGVKYGSGSYMRMFGYTSTVHHLSVALIFTIFSFLVRNFGGIQTFKMLILPFIFTAIVVYIISIFLAYSEYFIVIDDASVSDAIWKSIKMTFYYWEHTFLLFILMFIIGLRIIINAIFVLLIPALIIVSTTLLAAVTLYKVGLIVGLIIGVVAFIFASYINAIVDVWSISVWVITFLKLTQEGDKAARDSEENKISEEEISQKVLGEIGT